MDIGVRIGDGVGARERWRGGNGVLVGVGDGVEWTLETDGLGEMGIGVGIDDGVGGTLEMDGEGGMGVGVWIGDGVRVPLEGDGLRELASR